MEDGPHLQLAQFEVPKGPLNVGQAVGQHHLARAQPLRRHVGAQHVQPVQLGLPVNGLLAAFVADASVGDRNSLRAIVMAIQNLAPAEILKVEIPTGVPWLYRLGEGLEVEEKRERALTALSS